MDPEKLRRAFMGYFAERGHTLVPSAGLIPHHPTAPMFTNSGMMPFVPYFLGEEKPPYARAASVQKCVRISGKHNDIAEMGKTRRHVTFFEMLGNWSFGDYFKEEAIAWAWEFLTEKVGLDGDRFWVTVHLTDDDAESIWHERIGLPMDRIQRLGDEENFWEMGDVGPCGPDSEIFYDTGSEWGEPGGPEHGGSDRFIEFWNLVFMDKFRHPDRSLTALPAKNIDTGLGLERVLMLLEGTPTVFETTALRPIVAAAERVTKHAYDEDDKVKTSLRIIADHARCMTFLVNDGVFPSNEGRGYVLRSVIRRAVRLTFALGVEKVVLPDLLEAVLDHMGSAYPDLKTNHDFIATVLTREEERFRQTLRSGLAVVEDELATGHPVSGATAFLLHDTYGFPIELTREIAEERGVELDEEGFAAAMEAQRRRGRQATKEGGSAAAIAPEEYRALLEEFGPTEFTGYQETETKARVLAVLDRGDGEVEVFLERTPFYAEGGGQVGDTGEIATDTGRAVVLDTTAALPGLHRHVARLEGEVSAGQQAVAAIDVERRDSIRRNHTGTHLLHWALREVLGHHVKQHGSYVHPDYLRFDFSHFSAVNPDELRRVEDLANERVLANEPVRAFETTKEHAEAIGAIAFFDEKYGDHVRVVEAGSSSLELCGGTHVHGLGMIGPIKVISESSIGANLRRVFAYTGAATLERIRQHEDLLTRSAELARAERPDALPEAIERLVAHGRELEDEVKQLRRAGANQEATRMAAGALAGVVVERRDGLDKDQLRDLALAVRDQPGMRGAVLIGSPDGQGVSLVAAVTKESGLVASELIGDAAKLVKGGGGKQPDVAVAGGKDVSAIDAALDLVRARLNGLRPSGEERDG